MTWLKAFVNDFFRSHHRHNLRCPHCRPEPLGTVWAARGQVTDMQLCDAWARAFGTHEGIKR